MWEKLGTDDTHDIVLTRRLNRRTDVIDEYIVRIFSLKTIHGISACMLIRMLNNGVMDSTCALGVK